MSKVKLPVPLFSEVLIANPMADAKQNAEVDKKAQKLPQDERDSFLREHMASLWQDITILAVGSDCRMLKANDHVIGTPEAVTTGSPTPDGKYLFLNERAFKGKW